MNWIKTSASNSREKYLKHFDAAMTRKENAWAEYFKNKY
jgi:hypothetical protein